MLSLLVLMTGLLLAMSVDRGATPATTTASSATLLDKPRLAVRLGRNTLQLTGNTASAEHQAALLSLASEHFASAELQTDFRAAVAMPDDWEVISVRLLYLVAATNSADASMDASGVVIRGITQDESAYANRLEFLQSALPDDRKVDVEVLLVPPISTDDLCRHSFASLHTESITFRHSSTSIRPSSFAYLDRLAEFAYECRTPGIAINGHSDAVGNEAWNLQISRARAQAVADHLIQKGVAPNRLIIAGFGSSHPVADNATVHGRERNRRIEIELR